jgi:hypothetical protein
MDEEILELFHETKDEAFCYDQPFLFGPDRIELTVGFEFRDVTGSDFEKGIRDPLFNSMRDIGIELRLDSKKTRTSSCGETLIYRYLKCGQKWKKSSYSNQTTAKSRQSRTKRIAECPAGISIIYHGGLSVWTVQSIKTGHRGHPRCSFLLQSLNEEEKHTIHEQYSRDLCKPHSIINGYFHKGIRLTAKQIRNVVCSIESKVKQLHPRFRRKSANP